MEQTFVGMRILKFNALANAGCSDSEHSPLKRNSSKFIRDLKLSSDEEYVNVPVKLRNSATKLRRNNTDCKKKPVPTPRKIYNSFTEDTKVTEKSGTSSDSSNGDSIKWCDITNFNRFSKKIENCNDKSAEIKKIGFHKEDPEELNNGEKSLLDVLIESKIFANYIETVKLMGSETLSSKKNENQFITNDLDKCESSIYLKRFIPQEDGSRYWVYNAQTNPLDIVSGGSTAIQLTESNNCSRQGCEVASFQIELSPRIKNIIDHIKTTEKCHLRELEETIPVWQYGLKRNPCREIRPKINSICDIVQNLLFYQKDFERDLQKVNNLEELLNVFMNYNVLFKNYQKYFLENCDAIIITIGDRQDVLKSKINLPGMLCQRLVHYKMFLEEIKEALPEESPFLSVLLVPLNDLADILDSCNRGGSVKGLANHAFVREFESLANSKEKSPPLAPRKNTQGLCFDIKAYGPYLLKDKFKIHLNCTCFMLFLFENTIFITSETEDICYHRIELEEIRLLPEDKEPRMLRLQNYVKTKLLGKLVVYTFEARTRTIQRTWRKKIEGILWAQIVRQKESSLFRNDQLNNDLIFY